MSTDYSILLIFVTIFFFSATLPNGVLVAFILRVAPENMRGMVSAVYVLTLNLIGYLIGPPGVALLSEKVFNNDLGLALTSLSIALGLIAIIIIFKSRNSALQLIQQTKEQ